jgi:hypothetical protein
MEFDSKDAPTILLAAKRLAMTVVLLLIAYAAYHFVLRQYVGEGRAAYTMLALWLLTAYIVLPRIHRVLSKIYLPNYFIGRVRTADGLLGDPVNLAFIGTKKQLMHAMERAGWQRADEPSPRSALHMMYATLLRRSYAHAPVSSLFLFDRKQDIAYQREINGNPAKRHHVRFWKTPPGWKLPGGFAADWLAAGTFDRSVGFSFFTLQITHRIAADTDQERDYIIQTLQENDAVRELEVVKDYSSGYHHRNGGGDLIRTDGAMPFIKLRR